MFSLSYTEFYSPISAWEGALASQNALASPAGDEGCQHHLEESIVCVAGWQKEKRQDGSLHVKQ